MSIQQGTTPARPLRGAAARLLLAAAAVLPLAVPLAACGPTAEQVRAEERASASPTARPFQPPSPRPTPSATPPQAAAPAAPPSQAPARVGVTGSQAGMPVPVQDACQFLLRREAASMPPDEAGACIRAAMTAGGSATQTLETASSWVPQGTHTVDFTTAPEFSLTLVNPELKLLITAGAAGDSLDTGAGRITADAAGTPEEAYAAVLVDAAELTVNPERVAELLAGMTTLDVDYGAVLDGAVRTRIDGVRRTGPDPDSGADSGAGEGGGPDAAAEAGEMTPTGLSIWLDDYYRPVRLEITGRSRGITSSITAVTTGWGAAL